jgi:CheY-like chemotaxis protein
MPHGSPCETELRRGTSITLYLPRSE